MTLELLPNPPNLYIDNLNNDLPYNKLCDYHKIPYAEEGSLNYEELKPSNSNTLFLYEERRTGN